MNFMNEQTNQLIEKLAEKLGTTAEHLWAVLVRQAPITAITNIAGIIIGVLLILVSALVVRKFTKDDDEAGLAWIIWGICAVVGILIILDASNTVATCFSNPEYWALKQIIK